MKKYSTKTFKFDKVKIQVTKSDYGYILHLNLNRYKKGRKEINTSTLYDAIYKKHKPYASIWADYQDKKLIGVEVSWDK